MKKPTENRKPNRKKIVVLVCVLSALAILATAATVTVATYTNSMNAQRTVAAYDALEQLFSSNYLAKTPQVQTVYVPDGAVVPNCMITVCNYAQGKQHKTNKVAVSYGITVRFVCPDGTPADAAYLTEHSYTGYSVTFRKNGGASVTLNSSHLSDSTLGGELTAGRASSDTYTLEFDTTFANDRPELRVEVVATPQTAGLLAISALFTAEIRAAGATNVWTGSFSDDPAVDPAEYDGFNYQVTGIGSGTCTLTWNSKVSLSDVSAAALLSISGATREGNSISFPVNSDDENHYDLQFYKVDISTETWEDMETECVVFTFTP